MLSGYTAPFMGKEKTSSIKHANGAAQEESLLVFGTIYLT